MDGKSKTPQPVWHPIPEPGQDQIQNPKRELRVVGPTRSSSSSQLPDGWTVVGRPRRLSGNSRGPGQVDKMQIVPYIYESHSSFNLPDGWLVEEKPCQNINYQNRIDRHYVEPETGMQFRSLLSVQRYLTEAKAYRATAKMNRYAGENQCLMQASHSKHYIEPGTGKHFLSLVSVERYLTEKQEYKATPKVLTQRDYFNMNKLTGDSRSLETVLKYAVTSNTMKQVNHSNHSQNRVTQKEHGPGDAVQTSQFDFASPPTKVKWVLSGPEGNTWSAFVDGNLVPKSVKQSWSEAFALSINGQV